MDLRKLKDALTFARSVEPGGSVHTHNDHYIQCGCCDRRMYSGSHKETPDCFHPVTVRIESTSPEQAAYTKEMLLRGAAQYSWARVGDRFVCPDCAALPKLPAWRRTGANSYGCTPAYTYMRIHVGEDHTSVTTYPASREETDDEPS